MKIKHITLVGNRPIAKFEKAVLCTQADVKEPYTTVGRITDNFAVLDFDLHHGYNGIEQWQTLFEGTEWDFDKLCAENYHVKTPNNGVHIYFAKNPYIKYGNTKVKECPQVDFKFHKNSYVKVYDELDELPLLHEFPKEVEFNEQYRKPKIYVERETGGEYAIDDLSEEYKNDFMSGLLYGQTNQIHTQMKHSNDTTLKRLGHLPATVRFGFNRKFNVDLRTQMYYFVKNLREFNVKDEDIRVAFDRAVANTQEPFEQRYVDMAFESRKCEDIKLIFNKD